MNVFWDSSCHMSRDASGSLFSWNTACGDEALSARCKSGTGHGISHCESMELDFSDAYFMGPRWILVDAHLSPPFYGDGNYFVTYL